jgi:hypothetical protein
MLIDPVPFTIFLHIYIHTSPIIFWQNIFGQVQKNGRGHACLSPHPEALAMFCKRKLTGAKNIDT